VSLLIYQARTYRLTLGVVAGRQGDIEQAVHYGQQALNGDRKSLPSLTMVSRDLIKVLKERYPAEPATRDYVEEIRQFARCQSYAVAMTAFCGVVNHTRQQNRASVRREVARCE
jgi:hypothetical protein